MSVSFRAVKALARSLSSGGDSTMTVRGESENISKGLSSPFCTVLVTRMARLGRSMVADILGRAGEVVVTNKEEFTVPEKKK